MATKRRLTASNVLPASTSWPWLITIEVLSSLQGALAETWCSFDRRMHRVSQSSLANSLHLFRCSEGFDTSCKFSWPHVSFFVPQEADCKGKLDMNVKTDAWIRNLSLEVQPLPPLLWFVTSIISIFEFAEQLLTFFHQHL